MGDESVPSIAKDIPSPSPDFSHLDIAILGQQVLGCRFRGHTTDDARVGRRSSVCVLTCAMWSPVLCKTEVSSVVCASAREVHPDQHKHTDTKARVRWVHLCRCDLPMPCIGFTGISLAVHVMGHDPLGFGNCRGRSSSPSQDHADRDLGSPSCCCVSKELVSASFCTIIVCTCH